MARANEMHNALVEMAAENEEGLMEKYFEEGNLSEEELAQRFNDWFSKTRFLPSICSIWC